jgi:hypothetical protein
MLPGHVPLAAVIVQLPTPTPVTVPAPLTVAQAGSLVEKLTGSPGMGEPRSPHHHRVEAPLMPR